MKQCRVCNQTKPLDCFYKHSTGRDGYRNNCITCEKSRRKLSYQERFRDDYIARAQKNYEANKEKVLKRTKEWYQKDLEKNRKVRRDYYKNNKGLCRSLIIERKAHVKRATPKWANRKELAGIYQNCPQGYHVDHVIPLRGENVSGLHVPQNLQYLPATENLSKGNRF